MTTLLCECRLFSDICDSQGSAAAHMRYAGIFSVYCKFTGISASQRFENQLRINRVTAISLVSLFFIIKYNCELHLF